MISPLVELRGLQLYAQEMEVKMAEVEAVYSQGLPAMPDGSGLREQLTEAAAESLLPELLRRSLILSLYASLEFGVRTGIDVLDRFTRAEPFSGNREFLKEAARHLKAVHGFDLFAPLRGGAQPVWILDRLRRCFLHGLGSKFTTRDLVWRTLEADARSFKGFRLEGNRVMLGPDLFPRLHAPVVEVVLGLAERVRRAVDDRGAIPGPR